MRFVGKRDIFPNEQIRQWNMCFEETKHILLSLIPNEKEFPVFLLTVLPQIPPKMCFFVLLAFCNWKCLLALYIRLQLVQKSYRETLNIDGDISKLTFPFDHRGARIEESRLVSISFARSNSHSNRIFLHCKSTVDKQDKEILNLR